MPECHCCGQSIKVGQLELTEREKRKVDWAGPPQNGRPNIIEAKRIKALAVYYEIEDWMSLWDETLSPDENEEIFRKHSMAEETRGPTMKEVGAKEAVRSGNYGGY